MSVVAPTVVSPRDENAAHEMASVIYLEPALKAWIDTATYKLCDEARDRISAEMRRHVDETVSELQEDGLSADSALSEAIRHLGNPKTARRAFRHANWTKGDQVLLRLSFGHGMSDRDLRNEAYTALTIEFALCLLAFAIWHWGTPKGSFWPGFLGAQAMLAPPLCRPLSRLFLQRPAPRLAAIAASLLWVVWFLAFFALLWGWSGRSETAGVVLSICFGFAYVVMLVRIGMLWHKLRRIALPQVPGN